MKWIRKCVDEGLIPDFNFTQDNAQQKAIVDPVDPEAATVVGVVVENPTFSHNLDESDRIFEYVGLPCLTGPKGICYSSCYDTAMLFQNWITGDCQYPEIAFRFMDMMYDRECYYNMQYGFEGEGWAWAEDWAEEQGVEVSDIFNRYADVIPGSSVECITLRDGWNAYSSNHADTWAIIPIYYVPSGVQNVHYASALKGFDPNNTRNYVSIIHDQALMTRLGKIPATNVPGTLLNGLTAEEEAATTAMRSNLNVHFFNTRTAFQTGELDIYDDQVWADYLAQLEAYGMSTVLKVYQNCYDRFLANK
jgi:putative aldouronate transport system substrate-binding protein